MLIARVVRGVQCWRWANNSNGVILFTLQTRDEEKTFGIRTEIVQNLSDRLLYGTRTIPQRLRGVCSRQCATQIHVYLYLYLYGGIPVQKMTRKLMNATFRVKAPTRSVRAVAMLQTSQLLQLQRYAQTTSRTRRSNVVSKRRRDRVRFALQRHCSASRIRRGW